MQPITIIQDPTRSAQSTHASISKTRHVIHSIGSICTGDCLSQRKKLEYVMLHEVVPQAPLQRPASPAESVTTGQHEMTCMFY
jgi:hypothetical protein